MRGARQIGAMLFLPAVARHVFSSQRCFMRIMQPAMPFRRHFGRLGEPFKNNPAFRANIFGNGAFRVIAIAENVLADEFPL